MSCAEVKQKQSASSITLVGYSEAPHPSVTFAIGAARWEYYLPSPTVLDAVLFIRKRGGAGKALVQAKRKATAVRGPIATLSPQ